MPIIVPSLPLKKPDVLLEKKWPVNLVHALRLERFSCAFFLMQLCLSLAACTLPAPKPLQQIGMIDCKKSNGMCANKCL